MSEPPAYDSRADTLAHIHAVRDNIDLFVAGLAACSHVWTASTRRGESGASDASYGFPGDTGTLQRCVPLAPGKTFLPTATGLSQPDSGRRRRSLRWVWVRRRREHAQEAGI
jgi:hypothetical protein